MPQVLKNVRFAKGQPLDDQRVIKVIGESKGRLGKTGRLVIRPSGTEPVIRVMAEGDDAKLIGKVVNDIVDALKGAAA
jgi:phosphoglucosamine mutase